MCSISRRIRKGKRIKYCRLHGTHHILHRIRKQFNSFGSQRTHNNKMSRRCAHTSTPGCQGPLQNTPKNTLRGRLSIGQTGGNDNGTLCILASHWDDGCRIVGVDRDGVREFVIEEISKAFQDFFEILILR